MKNQYQQFKKGERVLNSLSEIVTVLAQEGCQVWIEEETNLWYHPANLRRRFPASILSGVYMTCNVCDRIIFEDENYLISTYDAHAGSCQSCYDTRPLTTQGVTP